MQSRLGLPRRPIVGLVAVVSIPTAFSLTRDEALQGFHDAGGLQASNRRPSTTKEHRARADLPGCVGVAGSSRPLQSLSRAKFGPRSCQQDGSRQHGCACRGRACGPIRDIPCNSRRDCLGDKPSRKGSQTNPRHISRSGTGLDHPVGRTRRNSHSTTSFTNDCPRPNDFAGRVGVRPIDGRTTIRNAIHLELGSCVPLSFRPNDLYLPDCSLALSASTM